MTMMLTDRSHIPHHILALWSLGASAEKIEHAYEHGTTYQRPRFDSPHIVTEQNFEDYLGDEKYAFDLLLVASPDLRLQLL
jgi:hypothetical protein